MNLKALSPDLEGIGMLRKPSDTIMAILRHEEHAQTRKKKHQDHVHKMNAYERKMKEKEEKQQMRIKRLLVKTQYLAEATRHSNPALQAKLHEYEMLLRNNATIRGVHGDHVHLQDGRTVAINDFSHDGEGSHSHAPQLFLKDYIIKRLEKLVCREVHQTKDIVNLSNSVDKTIAELPAGSVINSATMIVPQAYLKNFRLSYNASESLPEDEKPLIATISRSDFKISLHKTNDEHVEKIRNFVRQIPGF